MSIAQKIRIPLHIFRLSTTCLRRSLQRSAADVFLRKPAHHSVGRATTEADIAEQFRRTLGLAVAHYLEEAGPVFAKIGQVLATREDLIPAWLAESLVSLYDGNKPMTYAEVEAMVDAAYRDSPFASFHLKPIGVGTVGQVHLAQLKNGERVVVKLAKPGLEDRVENDVAVITFLLEAWQFLSGRNLTFVFHGLADLRRSFLREVDLTHEAAALKRFKRRMRKNKNLVVPKCYQDLSNRNILVMELLEGDTLSSWQKRGDVSADDKKRLAGSILSEVLQQIFADGDFHGDPHGGNFIVMKDGRLGMIDLGLTGDLDSKGKAYIIKAMKSILAGDPDQALRSLLSFGVVPEGFDYLTFKESVGKVFSSHRDNVKQNGFEPMISDLFRVSQQHGLYIPTSTTVLIKSLVTIDGLARSLDPEINVAAKSIPIVLKGTITSSWQGSLERLKRFVSL